jgi:hypothetical protein
MATHCPAPGLTDAHTAVQLSAAPVSQQLHRFAAFTDVDAKNRAAPASPESVRIANPPTESPLNVSAKTWLSKTFRLDINGCMG